VAPTITTSLVVVAGSTGASPLPLLEQQQPPPSPPPPPLLLLPSILTLLLGRRGRFLGASLLPMPATAAAAMGERATTVPILVMRPLI
jgi:hypothetical protein